MMNQNLIFALKFKYLINYVYQINKPIKTKHTNINIFNLI